MAVLAVMGCADHADRAFGPSDVGLTRCAIVRFGAMPPGGYRMLPWGNGF
jgi:hypothetical protein